MMTLIWLLPIIKEFHFGMGKYAEILLGHGLWYACMKLYRRRLFDEYVLILRDILKLARIFLCNFEY